MKKLSYYLMAIILGIILGYSWYVYHELEYLNLEPIKQFDIPSSYEVYHIPDVKIPITGWKNRLNG